MIRRLEGIVKSRQRDMKKLSQYIFYILQTEPRPTKIISAGIISGNITILTGPRSSILYLYLRCLLSRTQRNLGGTSAIYHILLRLPETYRGICLDPTPISISFYTKLGFIYNMFSNVYILDKTDENIQKLKEKLRITTEFHSTYPDNIII